MANAALQRCADATAVAALYGPLEGRGAYVITGASSGFGLETALALARAGAATVLACRPGAKAEAAAARVRLAAARGAPVHLVPLDLAEPASIRACAAAVAALRLQLSALVLNAGVIGLPFGAFAPGMEPQLQVNLLGHALLHELLRPALEASPDSRVVVVASGSNYWQSWRAALDLAQELPPRRERFSFGFSYSFSNICRILWARALAKRVPYPVLSLHPAVASTGIAANFPRLPILSLLACVLSIIPKVLYYEWRGVLEGQTAAQGARTQTWVAVAPRQELARISGAFLSGNTSDGPLGLPRAPCAVAQRDDYADAVLAFAAEFIAGCGGAAAPQAQPPPPPLPPQQPPPPPPAPSSALAAPPALPNFSWLPMEPLLGGCAAPCTPPRLAALAALCPGCIVSLTEQPLAALCARNGADLGALGDRREHDLHAPIADMQHPSQAQLQAVVAHVCRQLEAGRSVVVHCAMGAGRTGTVLAAVLVARKGWGAERALRELRACRPRSVETRAQEAAVEAFAAARAGSA